jgi:large-conductance mechanosensitive channel
MDQPVRPFSDGADTRRWIGRLIIAVILGEAIWALIVSVINNLVVPWLGDVMGQSSGLPTSFTQRPYNYPELFVSVFEFCIAGLVAAVLNYFFQRPAKGRVRTKTVTSSVAPAAAGPVRVIPQVIPPSAPTPTPLQLEPLTPVAPQEPVAKIHPVYQPAPDLPTAPFVPEPAAIPAAAVVPQAPVVPNPVTAKPLPNPPKPEPAKPKKPKNVYYNIVGEPMPSDED